MQVFCLFANFANPIGKTQLARADPCGSPHRPNHGTGDIGPITWQPEGAAGGCLCLGKRCICLSSHDHDMVIQGSCRGQPLPCSWCNICMCLLSNDMEAALSNKAVRGLDFAIKPLFKVRQDARHEPFLASWHVCNQSLPDNSNVTSV